MTSPGISGVAPRLAALLVVLRFSLCLAGGEPLPYRLAVEVGFGSQHGSESFREELERQLLHELQRQGCFRETTLAGGPVEGGADLILRVAVSDLERRTDYDISIAQRAEPDRPATERMPAIARMEATIEMQLLLPGGGAVRSGRFKGDERFRPQLNEDAEYEVQLRMIESTARTCRKFVCKGGLKRLEREIARARAAR